MCRQEGRWIVEMSLEGCGMMCVWGGEGTADDHGRGDVRPMCGGRGGGGHSLPTVTGKCSADGQPTQVVTGWGRELYAGHGGRVVVTSEEAGVSDPAEGSGRKQAG